MKTNLIVSLEYKNILYDFFYKEGIVLSKGKHKRLIVLLGSFADFDSFEYSQHLSGQSEKLTKNSIDLILVGIGSQRSKELFCRFNKLDIQNVIAVSNSDIHNQLNLNRGLVSQFPAIINLLIMCMGINSRGTIKEVLRGYLGDRDSKGIFGSEEIIKIGPFSLFKGKMFELFAKEDILRPLELATKRLGNMIEILSNWNIYVPDPSFLTQRGATFFLNENDEVIYKFISKSLLGYSANMSTPLSFIDKFLN